MESQQQQSITDCVILAGGSGVRMGGPKALLEVGGETLLRHQFELLSALFPRTSIALKNDRLIDRIDPLNWHQILIDPPDSRSLLDVLGSIITRVNGPVFIAAVDLPQLTASIVTTICSHHSTGISVIPVEQDRPQPLAAVWDPAALEVLEPADGDLALLAWVRRAPTRLLRWPVDFPEHRDDTTSRPFQNLNSPEDLDSLEPDS